MNEFFESIKTGLNQAIDYERGDKTAARRVSVTVAALPEYNGRQIKQIRESLGLTQRTFAYVMGVSSKTVEAWEASHNTPQGPAQRVLSFMDAEGKNFLRQYNLVDMA